MKKLCLTSVIAITLAVPALADPVVPNIAPNAESADCTQPVLGTTSGTSNLEANWNANTLYLSWSVDGQPYATNDSNAASCTYDQGIIIPTNPTKTGYTFAGWKVKSAAAPQQTTITLSSLYDSGEIDTLSSKSLNPGVYCEGMENGDWYGHDEDGDCTDNRFSGLNNGEWTVTMPNGNIVKGVATCSTQHPTTLWYYNNNTFTSDNFSDSLTAGQYSTDNSSGMQYCWCKPTSADTGSGFQSVASSSWVFSDADNADSCAYYCASYCADYVSDTADFRRALFGVTE